YFKTLAVTLINGRFFDARDNATAPAVVIVNDALAGRQWPGENPVGQSLLSPVRVIGPMGRSLMPAQSVFHVVGVVANVKNSTLVRDAEPAIYHPFRQFPFRGLHIVVQGRSDPSALIGAVRTAVRQLDPNLPIAETRTLDRVIGEATDRPRSLLVLMAVFAGLALALAALGIYSVMSYRSEERRVGKGCVW